MEIGLFFQLPAWPDQRPGDRYEDTLRQIWLFRRMFSMMVSSDGTNAWEATEELLQQLKKSRSNGEYLHMLESQHKVAQMSRQPATAGRR